jgi:dipeptidyl-peptidase-4
MSATWFIFLAMTLGVPRVSAQPPGGTAASSEDQPAVEDQTRLTVERIFEKREFIAQDYDAIWSHDRDTLWRLEAADPGPGQDLVRIDVESGRDEIVVAAAQLIPPGRQQPLKIESFQWSSQGDKLLFLTGSQRVWRQNTRGDYWVFDRTSRILRRLGGDAPPASLMFAKFAPDSLNVAYVRDRQIWLESLLDHSIKSLTPTTSEHLIHGTFDWVYEEELDIRDGFRWSPDGHAIAFWQLDTSGVRTFTLINNTDQFYPTVHQFAYPKTGQRNSAVRIGVVNVDSGSIKWMQIPGDPREHYLCRMEWDGPEHLWVQQLNRLQNINRLFRVDVKSGLATEVLTESDAAWVDVHDEMKWLAGRNHFTWISERDGWRHAYRISTDGQSQQLFTPGAFDVIELLHVDPAGQHALLLASPENATQCYLYRVNLDGSHLERLTPPRQSGTHRYRVSPSGKFAIHRWSTFERPPRVELIAVDGHRRLRLLETNRQLRRNLRKLDLGRTEFFRLDIGEGIELDAWAIYPTSFDPTRRYPALVYVYGEPGGQTVVDRWGGDAYLWHQMLAQKGYFIVSIDNRGTPAPRGRAWRKSVHRQVGVLAPEDQAKAVRRLLSERTYLDPERVGVWGWSGGGSMALNAIFKYPELYHTAIAVAPVANQRHYDTIYQERYMGLPSDNVEGYLQGSPIHFADRLQGHLLVIHGTGDDNVHYQSTEALINELVRHRKTFQMMAYPNRTHSIREGVGTSVHLRMLMTEYLLRYLPPGK